MLGIERPTETKPAGACPLSSRSVAAAPYQGGKPPLLMSGGSVMGSSSQPGAVSLTPVFWAPSQASFGTGYVTASTKFVDDLAASSGSTASPFSVLTQYTNGSGTHLAGKMTATTPIADTQPFPADPGSKGGCSPDSGPIYNDNTGYSSCVDDNDIMNEILRLARADSLSTDFSHLYVIYLPKGTEDCYTQPIGASRDCTANNVDNSNTYCAYHSSYNPAPTTTPLLYAVIPYTVWNSSTGVSCNGSSDSPNSFPAVDYVATAVSHEIAEAITDPMGDAWHDRNGNEIGDLCAYVFGPMQGAAGYRSDTVLNGTSYLIQEEFSNAGYKLNHAAGCQATWTPPTVALSTTGSLVHGQKVTFHPTITTPSGAVLSRSWTLDGLPAGSGTTLAHKFTAGTHTVTLTVTDTGTYSTTATLTVSIS